MRLLLATDGTTGASAAVDLVATLPRPADLVVDVVSVVEAPSAPHVAFAPVPAVRDDHDGQERHARDVARAAAASLSRHGIQATPHVLHGDAVHAIIERAIETGSTLIVCGSRGRSHLQSILLGSVSRALVERAPCSVLVARHLTDPHMHVDDGKRVTSEPIATQQATGV